MTSRCVAVVGAGVAGLACASRLQAGGVQVRVFEQAAQAGGRCSSLRTPAGLFDHGAASFTAGGETFARQVQAWSAQGLLVPDPHVPGAWMGRPSMSAWTQGCGVGLTIETGREVAAIEPAAEPGWMLRLHGAVDAVGVFDAVLVATPPEAAAVLLQADPELAATLRAVRCEPCWSVLAAWAAPLGLDEAAIGAGALLQQVRREEAKPGHTRVAGFATRWVLRATPYWSVNNLDVPPDQVVRHVLEAFGKAAGRRLARPAFAVAHLWRQAQVALPLPQPCGWNDRLRLGACGDVWGAQEADSGGVERAWSSGIALAERVLAT